MHVGRLELAPKVMGAPYALALDGAAGRTSYTAGKGQWPSPGWTRREATSWMPTWIPPEFTGIQADEPPHGMIAGVAKLPDLGAIAIKASLEGPREAVATRLAVSAGQLDASAQGTVDLVHTPPT